MARDRGRGLDFVVVDGGEGGAGAGPLPVPGDGTGGDRPGDLRGALDG
ncbi:MAG TPA: hypothetical protein VK506_03035 [Conexibacter sp.]|nr:hypothetical protein [Conexibacter sp.]